ncbi:MAG: hypothetical protein LYZ66_06995 [Nitrososphaerales archaeon]|nr:hypothetical protein [Nitrososphaerales archaeon]
MQTKVFGKSYLSRQPNPNSDSNFAPLFIIAGSKRVDLGSLKERLGLSEDGARMLIEELQKGYLVDVFSQLEGDAVVETLRLTDLGTSALQAMMERMCELPELH